MTTRRATMLEDGRLLVGREWIRPSDYATSDVELGLLPSIKGVTPREWPSLDDDERN